MRLGRALSSLSNEILSQLDPRLNFLNILYCNLCEFHLCIGTLVAKVSEDLITSIFYPGIYIPTQQINVISVKKWFIITLLRNFFLLRLCESHKCREIK
jgi:hypothetical protein